MDEYGTPSDREPSPGAGGGGGGNDGSPPRVASTPEQEPAGRHYHYVAGEILVVEDDVRLIADQIGLRGLQQIELFRPTTARGAGVGVVRFRLPSPDGAFPARFSDVLTTVTELRTPVPDPEAPVASDTDPTPPTYVPRVSPNIVVGLSYHGRPHGAMNRRRAEQLDSPRRRRFLPLPGHAVKIGFVDTGIWRGQLDWFGDRVDLRPEDEEPLGNELTDISGHGTFIAGVIHAIAPGAEVRVRRFGDGSIADRDLAAEILALVEEGVDIINLSLGGPTHENTGMVCTEQTIELLRKTHADLVIVASAGNAGVSNPEYPAAFKGVVGVAAIDAHDEKAPFSNFGPWLDACAPGVDVHSTFIRWQSPESTPSDHSESFEGYARWSGTSFSAPAVAGEIAVRRSPGGWRQFLWFLRPRNARQAADRLLSDPDRERLLGLGAIVKPVSHARRHRR